MADPATGATTSSSSSTGGNTWLTQMESFAGDVGAGLGLASGLQRGGVRGDIQAASSAAKLGSRFTTGTALSTAGGYIADVNNLANIYAGIHQGGVSGYTGAAVNAAQLYGNVGTQLAKSGMGTLPGSTEVASVAAPLASAYSIYNFAKNYQSGATGADALYGAQMGASLGMEFGGPVGALIGTAAGAAFGAASSIFGPGREDPENIGWNEYAQAYSKGGSAGVQGASPSQNYQMLAGIFDSRGSNIPFYNRYGRMGEGQFTADMTKKINSAIQSGQIAPNASASDIYSKVVEPWITSMSPNGWQNTSTIQGAPEKQAVGNLLTQMIGQWQQGQLSNRTALGISGQTDANIQPFAGSYTSPQAYQQQQSFIQQVQSQFEGAVNSLTTALGVTARHG